jgi:hypothetical protein
MLASGWAHWEIKRLVAAFGRTRTHLIDVTSHPLATAYLHILEPRNPFPPQTTSLFTAADIFDASDITFPGG